MVCVGQVSNVASRKRYARPKRVTWGLPAQRAAQTTSLWLQLMGTLSKAAHLERVSRKKRKYAADGAGHGLHNRLARPAQGRSRSRHGLRLGIG